MRLYVLRNTHIIGDVVHARMQQGSGVPTDFRYVIARKPRDGVSVPRKSKGDYEGFLTGVL